MSDRSISPTNQFGAIDFSRPTFGITLLLAIVGISLVFLLYHPFTFGSAIDRKLLPAEAAVISIGQLHTFGVETSEQLITTLPVEDDPLILFVRDRLGVRQGNEALKNTIPAYFWVVAVRPANDHTTAFEFNNENAGSIQQRESKHALIKIDESGRWFQFYHRPNDLEQMSRLSTSNALALAKNWFSNYPLWLNIEDRPFNPELFGAPVNSLDGEIHRFQWKLPGTIEGLTRRVTIEITGSVVSYCGLEFEPPVDYPYQFRGIWRFTLGLRIFLLVIGIPLIIYLLIKQLRRDAIDFHFSFTYSALLTFPLIALVIAELPSLMNEGVIVIVRENFYLLSSATFLWLILLLVVTPVVALTDSLVRQVWPEKLSTFDALIRGRLQLTQISRATIIGLSMGLIASGAITVANALLSRRGSYSHTDLLSTSLSGPVASFWAIVGSLGLALVFSYLLLFIATVVQLYLRKWQIGIVVTALIWFVLLSASGGRFSSLLNFGIFAVIATALNLFLLMRYDLLTVIIAQFAALVSIAGTQLLMFTNDVYKINGLVAYIALGAVFIYAQRLSVRAEPLLEPEFVPQYITRLHSRERIERDIEIARQLQFRFLPQELPQLNEFDIATVCRPAYEVGGDYYDFIELDEDHIGLVIADVSGKGIPAAFYMTMIKGIIQSSALDSPTPAEMLAKINMVIYKNTGMNTFVTLFYAIIDTAKATIVYSNAGHNPPLLISRNGQPRELSCGGVVLGVIPQPDYEEEEIAMKAGDLLLLYTDGVVETTDVLGREFGTQRLAATVKNRDGRAASHLITDISKALDTFAAGAPQSDDITMILVSYKRDEKANYRN